jgi:peptidoglycan hydrolase-like protein with peptidoglycan-binding domain
MTRRLIPIVLVLALALLAAPVARPVAAHPEAGGWSDNHQLCDGCDVQTGNIVMLWQAIVWADLVGDNCGDYLDGIWGPVTKGLTVKWQQAYGLQADGIVGPKTWAKAQSRLVPGVRVENGQNYTYPGRFYPLELFKFNDNVWSFRAPTASEGPNVADHPIPGPGACA